MDLTLISPIVRNGRVVAFAGSVAHAPDLGGAQKWNLSTDVFVEAIRLPLMRFSKGGERDETLYELLKANSRLPELMAGDLEAQLAAMRLIRERVLELLDEYRLDNIDAMAEAIFGRSEHAMRLAVDAIPDGRYGGEVRSDSFPSPDGEPPTADGEPIVIKVAVDVRGSDVTMDFTGSSAERPGSFNSVWTFTSAYALYALRLILVPYVSNNAGFYRPVTVVCPEGTVVNARYPAATLSRHVIGHQVVDAVYAALAPVLPDRVIAEGGSTPSWDLLLMGEDADGRAFHRLVIVNGGTGASPNQDGATCCFPANLSNTPIEVLERLMPIACECKEIIADSAGAGRRRGGFGQRLVLRALAPVKFSLINARVRNAPKGLLGGSAARAGRALARGEELPPGSDGLLGVGETLEIDTPGGGGVGDERERDPVLVERDLAQGFVTSRPLEESLFSDAAQEC
jgi:N-methylhydantoinase B